MINLILEVIKAGVGFFQKKSESTKQIANDVNETNREEIKQGYSWRNALGYVCVAILAYSYVIVPLLDYFGIIVFQLPLGDIIRIIVLLLSGS